MKADKKLKFKVNKNKLFGKLEDSYEKTEQKVYKKAKSQKTTLILRSIIALFFSLLLLFCLLNIKYLSPSKMKEHMSAVFSNMGKGDGFPYRFSSNEVLSFFQFSSNDYVVLTKNDLLILNHSAKPVLVYTHNMANPVVKYSSDRILLFDQGSTKAVVLNQSGVVLEFSNEDKIICGDISAGGKTVLALNTENRKQIVNVYSFSGKKLMKWEKGSGYIVDTAINPSGTVLSVGLLDTVDAVQTVSVINFNVSTAQQKGHYDIKESVLYDLAFINSNELAVICNNILAVFNTKCQLKHQTDLPSTNHLQLYLDQNGHFVNVYSLYNNGTYLIDVYNSGLKRIEQKECQSEVVHVNCQSNRLSVLYADHRVEQMMIGGKITYLAKTDSDASFVVSKGRNIYLCSSGVVDQYKAVKQ